MTLSTKEFVENIVGCTVVYMSGDRKWAVVWNRANMFRVFRMFVNCTEEVHVWTSSTEIVNDVAGYASKHLHDWLAAGAPSDA